MRVQRLTTIAAATLSAAMVAGVSAALVAPNDVTDDASTTEATDDASVVSAPEEGDDDALEHEVDDVAPDDDDLADDDADDADDDADDDHGDDAATTATSDRPSDRPSDSDVVRTGEFEVVVGDRHVGTVILSVDDAGVLSVDDVRTAWRFEVEQEHRHEVKVWFHREGVTVLWKAEFEHGHLETSTRATRATDGRVDEDRDHDNSGPGSVDDDHDNSGPGSADDDHEDDDHEDDDHEDDDHEDDDHADDDHEDGRDPA